jgi:hypothetical protein
MTPPHKICPQCKTPAPLDAGFCGQCGRQYRTQFAPPPASTASPPVDDAAPRSFPIAAPPRAMLRLAQAAVALVAFLGVLLAAGVFSQGNMRAPNTEPQRVPAPVATTGSAPEPPTKSTSAADPDPVTLEAQRVIQRENERLDISAPAGAVAPDGKIHLKGGGAISPAEWEAAHRKLQESPLVRNPPSMPPF